MIVHPPRVRPPSLAERNAHTRAARRQVRTALFTLITLTGLGMAVVFASHAHLGLAWGAAAVFVGFGWPAFLGLADPYAVEET